MIECSGCKTGWCPGCVPDLRATRPKPLNEKTLNRRARQVRYQEHVGKIPDMTEQQLNQLRRKVFIQQSRKAWFEGYKAGDSYKFTAYLYRDDLYQAYRRGAKHHMDVKKNFTWGTF